MKRSKLLTIPLAATRMLLVTLLLTMTAQTARATISGDGSAENPYIISDATDWNTFAGNVTNGTESYEGKYVKLADTFDNSSNPVTASTMAGTSAHPFKGTFDGNGRTLTVNIDGTEGKCAPFHFVNGATIKYLCVEGSVTSTRPYSAGIVGNILGGTVNIHNCVSNVTITNNQDNNDYSMNNAGLVGYMTNGTVTIKNCLFSGDLHQGTSNGTYADINTGMLGYAEKGTLKFENCLFAPSGTSMNHSGYSHTYVQTSSKVTLTYTDCYYTVTFGTAEGQAVGERTNDELAAALGSGWEVKNGKVVPVFNEDAINSNEYSFIHNLTNASVNGMENGYLWKGGSAINIIYRVKASDGTDLTKDTHYTATINTINNEAVTSVTDVGNYTLTITAKEGSGYTGSKTINFSVLASPEGLSVDNDYSKGQDGYYYVNMPGGLYGTNTIILPAGLSSFKVYDDGGKDNNYNGNLNSTLVLKAPTGYVLQLSGSVTTDATSDVLTVYNNSEASGTKLLDQVSSTTDCTPTDITTVISSGQSMTLYFLTDQTDHCAGLDLTVRLIGNTEHGITVNTVTGGSVTSDKTTAKPGETVTLSVGTPTSGYMLSGVNVQYGSSENVSINWDGMNDNTITFTMPDGDVSVTPTFTNTLTAASGLFINMPATGNASYSIPSGVTSFKVYDNGGKNGNYSNGCNGMLTLTAPSNEYVLQLSGSVATDDVDNMDYLIVYDGASASGTELLPQTHSSRYGEAKTFNPVVSSGQSVTLYFKTNDMRNFSGLDLTVTVGSATSNNSITVNTATGGSITSIDKTSAKANETVTLTATPNEGYLLKEIIVSDGSSTYPVTNGNWHSINTATFSMPITAVSVTPVFTDNLTVDGGLYINMPKTGNKTVSIPSGVGSFKVYDDGGENDLYSDNCSGTLTLTAPEGYVLRLSGSITTEQDDDKLDVYNGSTTSDSKLLDGVSSSNYWEETAITTVTSSGQSMMLSFHSDNGVKYAGLDLTVTLVPITYTVSFQKNNDNATGTMDAQTHTYDAQLALTANAFEYTGYAFAGWATTADGEKAYDDQQSVSNLTTTQGANVELFAKWTAIEYNITYDLAGGTVATGNPATYNVESATITLNNPTREGYTFAGWTGTDLDAASTSVTIAKGSTGNREYTATWNIITYNITYNGVEGATNPNPAGYTIESEAITLDTPTKDGYTFAGWFDNAGFTGDAVTTIAAGSTGDKTFWAKWIQDLTYGGVTIKDNGTTKSATLDASQEGTISITSDVVVNAVELNRDFTANQPATVMLPFSLADGQAVSGGSFYKFSGVTKDGDVWKAQFTEVATLKANTPYLFNPSATGQVTFNLNGGTVTLNTTTTGEAGSTASNWEFCGTYQKVQWDGSASDPSDLSKTYGFAKGNATIAAGQFVHFAAGAWLKPMRCYLVYNGSTEGGTFQNAPSRTRGAASTEELPQTITVVLLSSSGETTAIGTLNTKTGDITLDGWYTMDGRKLEGKPTKKGLYINNGRKIVIK